MGKGLVLVGIGLQAARDVRDECRGLWRRIELAPMCSEERTSHGATGGL